MKIQSIFSDAMTIKSSNQFWRRVLGAYIGGKTNFSLPKKNIDEYIYVGESIHILEFLDFFKNQFSADSSSLLRRSRERRAGNIFDNRVFREEIQEVDYRARQRFLPYAWLKGGTFLRRKTYPKGLRRLSDLDLLVRKEDLVAWHELFREIGYRTHRSPEWILHSSFSEFVSSTFYSKDTDRLDILIDVHWHLVDYPARRACGRWDFDMEPVFEGIEDAVLRPEHRVLYLIDHAFTHEFRYWKFIADLFYVVDSANLNHAFLQREARRTGFMHSYRMGLKFLEDFFEEDVPVGLQNLNSKGVGIYFQEEQFTKSALNLKLPDGAYLRQSWRWLSTLSAKLSFLRYVLLPPITAVPKMPSNVGLSSMMALYGKRLLRILRKGPSIWMK